MAINTTAEFDAWFLSVYVEDKPEARAINRVLELLKMQGMNLGFPHSSAVKGAEYAIRELRPRSGDSRFRVFYAFDALRDALVLLGGSKTEDLYGSVLARAIALWKTHIAGIENLKREQDLRARNSASLKSGQRGKRRRKGR